MNNPGVRELIPINQPVFTAKKAVEPIEEVNHELPFSSESEGKLNEPGKAPVIKNKKPQELSNKSNPPAHERRQEPVSNKKIQPPAIQPAEQPIVEKSTYLKQHITRNSSNLQLTSNHLESTGKTVKKISPENVDNDIARREQNSNTDQSALIEPKKIKEIEHNLQEMLTSPNKVLPPQGVSKGKKRSTPELKKINPEIRTIAPNRSAAQPPMTKKNFQQPKLIIGKIHVEVISPAPAVQTKQVQQRIQIIPPVKSGEAQTNKLNFGLGQL